MSHARHKRKRTLGIVGRSFLAGALTVALSAGIVPAASADTVGQDISKWQGSINVNALGSFVIVKAGGSDIGYYYTDSMYARNARAVRAAGKGLGHYYFNGYTNPTSAANSFVNNLVEYRKGDPLVYDAEESQFVSPAAVQAWVNQVRARLGSDANVYVYMSSSVTKSYNWSSVAASGVKLWVANYGSNNGAYHGSPSVGYWDSWLIHQYTSAGKVSGYSSSLDMNLAKSGAFTNGQTTGTVTIPTSVSSVPTGTYLGYSIAQTQRLLNVYGYKLAVDNSYGPATRAAVRDFQSKHGLTVDGYAGPATQAKLAGTHSTPKIAVDNSAGTATVNLWQHVMGTSTDSYITGQVYPRGYARSALHAVRYGGEGSQLIRKVQRQLGLNPDGLLGPTTIHAIQRHLGVRLSNDFDAVTVRALQIRLNTGKF
ncbi:MAG: peptidoglycan-binding protein [Bifidobacterium aquikefiri]|uniref:Glycosyl hydrolase n=1 Tax=Bifidobacterium aquikefiri TaxID=1653207 RepID=A0A261G284_9BIFI|nr:peptidoglycan-binding protein [Bifidobacterium aquikefiri]OZG65554.1 glycosyl hydrolase [Bifidobacterium aquikefiri]